MIIRSLAVLAAALLAATPALSQEAFRAPRMAAPEAAHLTAPLEKAATATVDASGLLRVGGVRDMPKAARVEGWTPIAGGFVARFTVTSETAQGIRAKLDLGAMPGVMQLRAQGSDPARVEAMTIDPQQGPEAWTPWTEGETQLIEIFSPVMPAADAVSVRAMLHFNASPLAKAAASCTISTACAIASDTEPALESLIGERKKSVMKIQYVKGGSGFICSATLIDTPLRPAAYVLTANHCIDDAASSNSIASFWFFESASCEVSTPAAGFVQRSGGMQLVFTSYNVDSTLMLMGTAPPQGAIYSPINPALMSPGTHVVSISHPRGDTSRWSEGDSGAILRDNDRPYDMYSVNFTHGIIEPGSSGSGIFTNAGGHLQLRGILSQGALDLNCSQPNLFTLYGRLEAFYPQIAQYIGAAVVAPDDAPNRSQEVAAFISPTPIDTLGAEVSLPNRRIDYAGDVDYFKFTIAAPSAVTAYTLGTQDTVGTIYDSGGHAILSVDDAQRVDTNTGVTTRVAPGTYFFGVSHWSPSGTGLYDVRIRADRVSDNYTSLWWNSNESGWGLNVNHQGNILFATLFTYNPDGSPVWLVMPDGKRLTDGSYSGPIYRTHGPAFNAQPWSSISFAQVGSMTLAFDTPSSATLTYTFNNVPVTKSITRQAFKALPECNWSGFDRSFATNFQDLWWNPRSRRSSPMP
jgi:lysyl endopeptidase